MSGPSKVYVIDPGKTSSPREVVNEIPDYLKPSSGSDSSGHDGGQPGDGQSGVALLFSYLAGPLSIFATRKGRSSRFWGYLSVFSILVSIVVIWMWRGLSYWSTRENPVGAVMLIAAATALISGCSAWTRAAFLAWRYDGRRLRRAPAWLRSPLAAGLFGLFCPGMGLFAAGRAMRAAAALWIACLAALAGLILSRAAWLWEFNTHAGVFAVEPDSLEKFFMIAGAAAVLGGLAWIVQALDGARLAGRVNNRKPVSRSNWAAAALLLCVMMFPFLFRPAIMADKLDLASQAALEKGMRIIPVHISKAAVALDPSSPSYAVTLIESYERAGERAAADDLREKLVARLEPSIGILEEAGKVKAVSTAGEAAVIPASPELEATVSEDQAPRVLPAELMLPGSVIPGFLP